MRRLCQKVRYQQDTSWIDLRCFFLVQLALHLAANSARVSAGNSVVLVCQDTSGPFRATITFQDSDLFSEKDRYDYLKSMRIPFEISGSCNQMSFLQQQPQEILVTECEACMISSLADSTNTHSHSTRDGEENIPAYPL